MSITEKINEFKLYMNENNYMKIIDEVAELLYKFEDWEYYIIGPVFDSDETPGWSDGGWDYCIGFNKRLCCTTSPDFQHHVEIDYENDNNWYDTDDIIYSAIPSYVRKLPDFLNTFITELKTDENYQEWYKNEYQSDVLDLIPDIRNMIDILNQVFQ